MGEFTETCKLVRFGLPVQLMSQVPNWGFSGRYHLDFISVRFRTDPTVLAFKNS
jgi:hypothetical protein